MPNKDDEKQKKDNQNENEDQIPDVPGTELKGMNLLIPDENRVENLDKLDKLLGNDNDAHE